MSDLKEFKYPTNYTKKSSVFNFYVQGRIREKRTLLELSSISDLKELKGLNYTKKSSVFNSNPQLGIREKMKEMKEGEREVA